MFYSGREAMTATQYPIATICGSMRYFQRMLKVADDLTRDGWIVLMPFSDFAGDRPPDDVKKMLDDMHFTKISMSDRVYVVGTHIGESTRNEINYVEEHGQEIIYLDGQEIIYLGGE